LSGFDKRLFSKFKVLVSKDEKKLYKAIKLIIGQRPYNLALYELAMKHSSAAKKNEHGLRESNERLEFLGDAVLDMVVAEFLFVQYPFKDEGFLTEVRAKIVNRESLNFLSLKIGLKDLLEYHSFHNSVVPKSIYGDSLEALIGAVYLDKGYEFSKKFIINKLLLPHFDLQELIHTITNYKSKLIEWAQKESKELAFETYIQDNSHHNKQFTSQVVLDEQIISEGKGSSKKKAEQDAARKSLEFLMQEIHE
jgi:ribonuclease-3